MKGWNQAAVDKANNLQRSGTGQAGAMRISLAVKPLSVNEAWQGRRFKTDKYKAYESEVLLRLPAFAVPLPPYRIYYEFGFSNIQSDWDNPCKPLQDVLQKKYGFNDRDIMEAYVKKVKVSKGKEYFTVRIETITE